MCIEWSSSARGPSPHLPPTTDDMTAAVRASVEQTGMRFHYNNLIYYNLNFCSRVSTFKTVKNYNDGR